MKKNYYRLMFAIVFAVGLTFSSVFVCAEENIAETQWEYKIGVFSKSCGRIDRRFIFLASNKLILSAVNIRHL